MDLSHVRRMGKQPYETVREQLEELGDRVISRQGEDGAPARQGYRRFLGALDELAGRLLDDDEIAQRGQDLLKQHEGGGAAAADETAGTDGGGAEAGAEAGASDAGAGEAARDAANGTPAGETGESGGSRESGGSVWTQASGEDDEADAASAAGAGAGTQAAAGAGADEAPGTGTGEAIVPEMPGATGEAGVGESWAAGNARVAEENAAGDGPAAAESGPGPGERTVDVVFSLPAGTPAERVALCGEFNDWSAEATSLAKGADGAWSVTVPLVPGTYRYKYLLDGSTWENGPDADRLEENAYGTLDSVIVVSG
jgi:hypothetical protein